MATLKCMQIIQAVSTRENVSKRKVELSSQRQNVLP